MNISQTLILFVTGLISIALLFFVLQMKFAKTSKNNDEGKLKISFSIWIGAIFLSTSLILSNMLATLIDALNIYESVNSSLINTLKTTSIFVGLSALWIVMLIFIIKILSILLFGDRKEKHEMESDNFSYFILKSLMLIGFTIALMPALQSLLKMFLPIIQTPFYH